MPIENNFKYDISIRINFPEAISNVVKQEKDRFVAEYGSKYKSEPHITLYLTRYELDRKTNDAFSELIQSIQKLSLKQFEISLLEPKIIAEEDRHRNLYVVGVSNKEKLQEIRDRLYALGTEYRHTLLNEVNRERGKDLEPHVTIGEINFDKPQAKLEDVQANLKQIVGKKITVSDIIVFFYIREPGQEKMQLLEKVTIPLS